MWCAVCSGRGSFVFFMHSKPTLQRTVNCVFLQVVKSMLDLKDEQLAVQMDAHDSLWGETGTFLLSVR